MASIILAGGQSKRMGSPKESLDFGGVSLLFRVGIIAAAASSPVLVVGGDKKSVPPFAKWVEDAYPGEGPVGGLISGLRAAGVGIHVVLACDMPFVQTDFLKLLLQHCAGLDAAVPKVEGRLHPLCAAYASKALPKLEQARSEGVDVLRLAVERLDFVALDENELRAVDANLSSLINVNSPEQLEEARARLRSNSN
jgi:molybdopterin-guanine dinucleotide biosynthesis protein A